MTVLICYVKTSILKLVHSVVARGYLTETPDTFPQNFSGKFGRKAIRKQCVEAFYIISKEGASRLFPDDQTS